jgi:CelD/BcsL family acetyltransferase involved in cellulose biosynthesis
VQQRIGQTMTVKVLASDDPAWAEFVSGHAQATIFHHPAWASLLGECYGYRPFVLASLDVGGEIEGGMPFMEVDSPLTGHRWVSLPFSDFCTPLCRDPTALGALVDYLVRQNRQRAIPRVEIHAGIPGGDRVFHATSFVLSKVRLSASPDATLKTFDKTRVREPIRQATRRGVEVRLCTSKSDLYTFYDMLAQTRRRLGAPVQPKRFFSLVWDRLIEKGLGFLLLAHNDSAPIAGTVYLHYGGMLTAKYNASIPEFWRLRPNHLVYWSGIKWACENGYRYFDFGRTEIDNQNLRDFKKGWAAEEEPLAYATISDRRPKLSSRRSRDIIGAIIRQSPLFVCRALGEILYGHYA